MFASEASKEAAGGLQAELCLLRSTSLRVAPRTGQTVAAARLVGLSVVLAGHYVLSHCASHGRTVRCEVLLFRDPLWDRKLDGGPRDVHRQLHPLVIELHPLADV